MAKNIAAADPITLEAALTAQAQRTVLGAILSRIDSAVGKGIPMANAAGAISATEIKTFTANGNPTPLSEIGVTVRASSVMVQAINTRQFANLLKSPLMKRRLTKLPAPLASSMEKTITVRA